MAEVSPYDRDRVIRTVLGEAGNEPDIGKVAAAHVIMNRARELGVSPTQVVLAPNQFESWSNPSKMMSYGPNSEDYKKTGRIVDDVFADKVKDPTGGAYFFLNPDLQAEMGRKQPSWAKGDGTRIGNHVFYQKEASKDSTPNYLDAFKKRGTSEAPAAATDNAEVNYLDAFKKRAEVPAEVATSAQPTTPDALQAGSNVPIPIENMTPAQRAEREASIARGQDNRSLIQKTADVLAIPTNAVGHFAENAASKALEASKGGIAAIDAGVKNPQILPSFEKTQTTIPTLSGGQQPAIGVKMTNPGSALSVLAGVGQTATAPLLGPLQVGQDQLEKLTGNKDFAEKAALLAPVPKAASIANEMRPAVQVLRKSSELIPEKYLPEAISALERNPDLTMVDVSKTARDRAKMISKDALAPKAQQHILDFVEKSQEQKSGKLSGALEVLGEMPDPHSVLTAIKERAAKTGKEVINPFVEKSKQTDISPILSSIDKELAQAKKSGLELSPWQKRLEQLRYELHGDRPDVAPMVNDVKGEQGLHWLQSGLRQEAQDLMSSAVGSERALGKKLMAKRQEVVGTIESANPGYKEKLAQFRTDKEVDDAFGRGLSIGDKKKLSPDSILESSPEAWKQWAKDAHPEELKSARLGALTWMKNELEGLRSGKKLESSPKDKDLIDKIEVLFGKEKGKEFADAMRDVHRRSQAVSELKGGSDTFQNFRAAAESPVRVPGAPSTSGALVGATLPIMGLLGEAAAPILGSAPGMSALIGLGLGGAKLGYQGMKHGYETVRYKSDLARRMNEAKRLTTPLSQQPDLLAMLKERQRQISGEQKPGNLPSSPLFQLLPR